MNGYISCNRCDYKRGSVIAGKFRVEKILGEGTFGQVFLVNSSGDKEPRALKLLKLWTVEASERTKLLKRFDQEYETGLIDSPYLVRSYGKGMVEGNPFIIMEFCSGGDLATGVENGVVDIQRAAKEILFGLRALHLNGKVHRDLKPENVLIKGDRGIALTDFGIAGDRNKRMTERGIMGVPKEIFGTYAYMPPEQINPRRGEATVLPTTDIFSFGVLIYQMLTGKLPFGSLNNEGELCAYVTNGKNENWNRSLFMQSSENARWLPLIEGCLKADFRTRIQSADLALSLVPSDVKDKEMGQSVIKISPVKNGVALRIMQGEEYGRLIKLNELAERIGRRVITVGRNDDGINNIIAIRENESSYISRKHCTLEYFPAQRKWYLRDGQWDVKTTGKWKLSTNGTFVDSMELDSNGCMLNVGQIISIGDVKLRVEGY